MTPYTRQTVDLLNSYQWPRLPHQDCQHTINACSKEPLQEASHPCTCGGQTERRFVLIWNVLRVEIETTKSRLTNVCHRHNSLLPERNWKQERKKWNADNKSCKSCLTISSVGLFPCIYYAIAYLDLDDF